MSKLITVTTEVEVDVEIDLDDYKEEIEETLSIDTDTTWEIIINHFQFFGKDEGVSFVLDEISRRSSLKFN